MISPAERFELRPGAKRARLRAAASSFDDARRQAAACYAAFYAGADNQVDLFKAEIALYDELKKLNWGEPSGLDAA